MDENGTAGHEMEAMLPQPLPPPPNSLNTGAPPTGQAPPPYHQAPPTEEGDEEYAARVLTSPTYSDLESPGEVSLGVSSVLSGQSGHSEHSRARLIRSPSLAEKQPLG